MTPRRRELFFKVMDGQSEVLPYLYHFDQFYRCEEICEWLIKRKIVGREFLAWAKFMFGVSMLDVAKHILKKLEHLDGPKKILVGRDIRAHEKHR